jgi:hypothetical protein
MQEEIDKLLWKWRICTTDDECASAFRDIVLHLNRNWYYLVGWSQFEAWGAYYVSPDRMRCIYVAKNPRVDPVVRIVEKVEFRDPADLANKIWLDQKGVIPFKRIAEEVKRVFGVDVEMTPENKFIRMLFGEASE